MEDFTFDYSRSTGRMRFRLGGDAWTVDRIAGQWEFLDADPRSGRLTVRCQLVIQGNTAYAYVPGARPGAVDTGGGCIAEPADDHASCMVASDQAFPQGRETFWRCCFARELSEKGEEQVWRLRDERTSELWFVKGYRGVANVSWLDHGSHCFVSGPATVDEQGVAHF